MTIEACIRPQHGMSVQFAAAVDSVLKEAALTTTGYLVSIVTGLNAIIITLCQLVALNSEMKRFTSVVGGDDAVLKEESLSTTVDVGQLTPSQLLML